MTEPKEKRKIEVAAALIFENGKILATKRGESPFPYVAHKYEFVGGKIEAGESGEDAVRRELIEEMEMQVEVGSLYAKTTYEYPDFIITLSLYECVRKSDFCLKVHESYAYIAPEDLKKEEWAPADGEILETLKRVFSKNTDGEK